MHSIPYLQERISQAITTLEIPGSPAALYEPIHYSLAMGGKRIRPLLTLLACDLFNGNIEAALPPALGIEMFHNFTLVHDDIMDRAPLRRGKETVYRRWDTNTAILSGDTMFTLAYDYLSRVDRSILPEVLGVFTRTAREVCEGQQMDMDFELESEVSLDEYLRMIRLKTAVLLGCSLKVGSLVAGAGEKDAEDLYHYGVNLGIAFQIQDDLLDTFGMEERFGKKSGGDIEANKKTFLYLKALELANEDQKQALQQCYAERNPDPESKVLRVKSIFTDLRVNEHARQEMEVYYRKACTCLERVSLPAERKMNLQETGLGLMVRSH